MPTFSQGRKRLRSSSPSSETEFEVDVLQCRRPSSPMVLIPRPKTVLQETATSGNARKTRRVVAEVEVKKTPQPSKLITKSSTKPLEPSHCSRCNQALPTSNRRAPRGSLRVPTHFPAWKHWLKLKSEQSDHSSQVRAAMFAMANSNHARTSEPGSSDRKNDEESKGTSPTHLTKSIATPESDTEDMSLDEVHPVLSPEAKLATGEMSRRGISDEETRQSPPKRLRRRDARVSYAMEPLSDVSEGEDTQEDGSDQYSSADSEKESDASDDLKSRTTSVSTDDDSMSVSEADVEILPEAPKTKKRVTTSSKPRMEKTINTSLPPIHNIEDCFSDMISKALMLGLEDSLKLFSSRPLNVATMCSGTESPLIALDLQSKALEQLRKPRILVHHHFSAEIDVIKQGYIERNFQPAKLFRDVREFLSEEASTATTAYGSEETIPGGIDILIAGFVCKDISRLNNHNKSLDDDGESGDTWRAIYTYSKCYRPSIVLIENVRGTNAYWASIKAKWEAIGYECEWTICDTKNYYIPQTRLRMYMIAIERSQHGKNVDRAATQWKEVIEKLQRQCSSPFDAFLSTDVSDQYEYSSLTSEPNWALCRLRYDQIRSEEQLGIRRPITRWSENGTVRPPDFANRKWYDSQSSRVYDCIDIASLQAARRGYDAQYKMLVWDVSQNVDRFKAVPGLLPCITPSGCDFVSNKQTALTGSQLLLLQGMPADKLLFAKETQKDRQDLAGNAMTTTVIGASLLAALIAASKAFRRANPHELQRCVMQPKHTTTPALVKPITTRKITPPDPRSIDVKQLQEEARLSSKLCNCEGTRQTSKAVVKVCDSCGHTACSSCAGNPTHSYGAVIIPTERRQSPGDFERKWRARLPHRLSFIKFPDVLSFGHELDSSAEDYWKAFVARVISVNIKSQRFCISNFERLERSWRIRFEAAQATLDLLVADTIEWHLYISCPSSEPGDSQLRKILATPLACAVVQTSLLEPKWKMHIPHPQTHHLDVFASPQCSSSWRRRLGLPEYKDEMIPVHLDISTADCLEGEDLTGHYTLLPHCGTAMESLYKTTTTEGALYLFLDQNPIGSCDEDAFVFSRNCRRMPFSARRISSATFNASWRPWSTKSGHTHSVDVTTLGIWAYKDVELAINVPTLDISMPAASAITRGEAGDCSKAIPILEVIVPEAVNIQSFARYCWLLEAAKKLPAFNKWQNFNAKCTKADCNCSPAFPRLLWYRNQDDEVTPHEDRKAAAEFERALKTRPPIISTSISSNSSEAHVQISINVASLVHRARSQLPTTQSSSWRLDTNHFNPAPERFPKFHLQSNSSDRPYTGPLNFKYTLGKAQRQSLAWMKAQESGVTLDIIEVEEDIHSGLGWRVEAMAASSVVVRGGVLADLPSFGKTVTTIALINSEFEEYTSKEILAQNNKLQSATPLIDVAATLVVCPPHITRQWKSEIKNCLGEGYKVKLIERFSDLQRLSIDDVRSSRIVLVSWSVFAEEGYIAHLGRFAAMPAPASYRGRPYDAWIDYVSSNIADRVRTYLALDTAAFENDTHRLLKERLLDSDFNSTVPLKVTHGSAYKSWNAMQADKAKRRTSSQTKSKSSIASRDRAPMSVPLLQLFNWNRVVTDEYHYLCDSRNSDNHPAGAAIKRLSAHKRWILSGTPALANFTDVSQLGSFLGVKLGRDVYGDGLVTTDLEKRLISEQTNVENFRSQTELHSYQWYQTRHGQAQCFLDRFVRQNEPELAHIQSFETLLTVQLSPGHHAVYLELSQLLISMRMQIKKLKNKSGSDRSDRLNASLNNSATAEEALLKAALLFETESGKSGLDLLIATRQRQLHSAQKGFENLALDLKSQCLKRLNNSADDHYQGFKRDMTDSNILGDEDACQQIRKLLRKVERDGSSIKRTGKSASAKDLTALKELASEVRDTAHEVTHRLRSERFISTLKSLLPMIAAGRKDQRHTCSSINCTGTASLDHLYLISHCGHTACEACLQVRTDSEACVHTGCEVPVQPTNLVKLLDLGSSNNESSKKSFGKKLDEIASLISRIPQDDQIVVFVPNDEVAGILDNVLHFYKVPFLSLGTRKLGAAKILEDFKSKKSKKVLVLNLMSESAAGANLVNANHVIFISPLLAKSQYTYDAAMAQAIARCRRYQQTKIVHIYHFAAMRTIDIDILEHRHRRMDAIHSPDSIITSPSNLNRRKEKTKLIRNRKGVMALVPVSWLSNESFREIIEVDNDPGTFTSFINFSETFEGENDD